MPTHDTDLTYLVVADFGRSGRAFLETDEYRISREDVITDIMTGQISKPAMVVAFDAKTCDVSEDIAREVVERAWRNNITLTPGAREFAESLEITVPEIERHRRA